MVLSYIEYFRQLAIAHTDIAHVSSQEGLDARPGDCRFGRFWNLDLYIAKTPSGITHEGPVLHLQMFDFEVDDSTGYFDLKGNFEGGFMITEKAILNNIASEELALSKTFDITMDYFKAMHENATSFCKQFTFEFSEINSVQVGPIWDNRFGWYTTFKVVQKLNLTDRPNKFTNGG